MGTILELNGIKKYYGKKEVLKGIGLQVEEGQVISVLGPSGCGKSTLLNIIAGILPLDEGSVRIYGKEVSSHGKMIPIEERNINMVFQDFALWPHMKARDNILYGLKVRRVDKDEQEKRLQEVVFAASGGTVKSVPGGTFRRTAAESSHCKSPDHQTGDHSFR